MEANSTSWPSLLLLCVAAALLIKSLIGFLNRLRLLPPGPWGLPVVGYLPWFHREAYITFAQLGKKYGGLFSVRMGGDTVVVLNDWPTIKATLADHPKVFSGRPRMFMFKAATGIKNVAFNDGPIWNKQKKLTAHCLRNIGMGKKSTESLVTEIVHQLLDKLTKLDKQVVPMESMFFGPILRVNWGIVSGDSVSGSVITVELMEKTVSDVVIGLGSNNVVGVFPWLRFLSPDGFGFNKFKTANDRLNNMFRQMINEHIAQWTEGNEADLLDHYITAMKNNEKVEEPPYNVEHLMGTMWDLFMAGSDTTNATCLWGFLYIASNPEVQKRAQAELDSVVGHHRLININDFPSLPYLDALTMEVHRLSSVIALSVPHSPVQDFDIRGYTIPKGTTCIQNIHWLHRDPTLWDEPEEFRPERFFDKNSKPVWPPYLMPFSIGSRKCLGQSIADLELKLIVGGLLQRMTFSLPQDRPKPTFQSEFGIVVRPQPYSLHIQLRN